jgi:hypothetical protein
MQPRPLSSLVAALGSFACLGLLAFDALAQPASPAPTPGEAAATPAAGEAAAAEPSPEAVKEAGQRYERGLELYSEGDYGLAVIEFERAYELVPNYRVLYNIGQVRVQLGRYAKAKKALEEYLAKGGDEIKPERKDSVKSDLEMLAGRTALLTVITNEPGADIVLDSLVVGQSPLTEALLVDAGEHTLEVRKPGFYSKGSPVKLAGREETTVTLEITKVPEVTAGRTVVERVEGPVVKVDRTPMWVAWAATGAFAIGAGVVGYFGMTKANDLESMRTDFGVSRKQLDDTRDSARTLFIVSDSLTAATVVAGGVALYLTLTTSGGKSAPKDQAPPPKVGLRVGPGQLGLAGTF